MTESSSKTSSNDDLNLKVLKRHDETISRFLGSSPYVVVYDFDSSTHSWKRKDIEGTLFIYER
jgi:hypothetical protein